MPSYQVSCGYAKCAGYTETVQLDENVEKFDHSTVETDWIVDPDTGGYVPQEVEKPWPGEPLHAAYDAHWTETHAPLREAPRCQWRKT